MREILFRGKRTDTGEWVEGNLVWLKNIEEQPYQCFIISQLSYLEYGEFDEMYQVFPETVGQYTGLPDKNGKRVFEDDIVKIDEDVKRFFRLRNGKVYFRGGCFLVSNNRGEILSSLYAISNMEWILRGEVIGNIHDNPELLKYTEACDG